MTYEEFKREAEELSFVVCDTFVFGQFEDYPVFFVVPKKNFHQVTMMIPVKQRPSNRFQRDCKRAIKGIGTVQASNLPQTILTKTSVDEGIVSALSKVMPALLSLIREQNMMIEDSCPFCHQNDCDGYAMVQSLYRPVHRECLDKELENVKIRATENLSQGSYLSGILGGLLGGFLGILPTILSILILQRIFSLLMCLVPIGVTYGYVKAKGKRSKASGPILILLSVLSTYFMEYVFWVIAYSHGAGVTVGAALGLSIPFLFDPAFWLVLTTELGSVWIFLILAILLCWRTLTQTAEKDIYDSKRMLQTFFPKK